MTIKSYFATFVIMTEKKKSECFPFAVNAVALMLCKCALHLYFPAHCLARRRIPRPNVVYGNLERG